MSQLLKYLIFGGILCVVGCVLIHEQMNQPENPPKQVPLSGEAGFVIPTAEIPSVEEQARNGNCDAGYRLGMYHFFVTLQNEDATIWFRIAAKCQNLRYKAGLVAALLSHQETPQVAAEVDSVIMDMKKIDPNDANTKAVEGEVVRRRQTASSLQ